MSDPIADLGGAGEVVDSFNHQRGGINSTADAGVADAGASNHHSNNKHFSHHEVEHERSGKHKHGSNHDRPKSAFSRAWEASRGKLLQGAGMFAAFGILLSLSVKAATAILGLPDPTLLTTALGTAFAGATWLGGNEFFKVYKEARTDEESRLNQFIDNAKERLHVKERSSELESPERTGELGIVAGTTLTSFPATTAFVVEAPVLVAEAEMPRSRAVERILAEGPRSSTNVALERGEMTATQRAEQSRDMNVEASV